MTLTRRELLGAIGLATAVGLAGCLARGTDFTTDCPKLPNEPDYKGWFDNVETYDGTCDMRGQDRVVIEVGTRGREAYWEFSPAAVAVSPGTTVAWVWTGEGGGHDVVSEAGLFTSGDLVADAGYTFEHVFADPGVFKYYCSPHKSMGMKGAVFVALE